MRTTDRSHRLGLTAVAALLLAGCGTTSPSGLPAASPATAPASGPRLPQSLGRLPVTFSVSPQNTSGPVGSTSLFLSCAVQVTAVDPNAAYEVVAIDQGGRTSGIGAISEQVPDLASGFTTVTGVKPYLVLWRGAQGDVQSHCVDLELQIPGGTLSGMYSANMTYAMYSQVQPGLGLYALRGSQPVTLTATVSHVSR